MFSVKEFLDLTHCEHHPLFESAQFVWDALKQIPNYLQFRLKPAFHGSLVGQPFIGEKVFIGKGTVVEHGAFIKGPAWIGENCHIRSGCYIRENVILGNGVIAGNSCEFKNCILLNESEVPHFSYVGDSILGYRAHLAAGVILSNLKLTRDHIVIRHAGETIDTGLNKFGAVIGDETEVGCNSVISPGSLLGKHCLLYPGTHWRGVLEDGSIVKQAKTQQIVKRNF
ncbi:MAG: UDP-N-acetylglucosamine diphosphorylase [Verrucomicrobiia bacterium]